MEAQSEPTGRLAQNSCLLGEVSTCFKRPLTDCMRPTHTAQDNLLSPESTGLNACSCHPKLSLTQISRIMFDQMSGHHGPAELTHEINHDCQGCENAVPVSWQQRFSGPEAEPQQEARRGAAGPLRELYLRAPTFL